MITIVTTTIRVPNFLEGYQKNIERYGHTAVDFIVVGDAKSQPAIAAFCKTLPNCTYLDICAQEKYMEKFSELGAHLPFNSIERRNVGMLMAYENGAEVVITLDDDNYATEHDVVGSHGVVGSSSLMTTYESTSGWFNVCKFLHEENDVEFYHRGYPAAQRWKDGRESSQIASHKVVVNAGLWTDNPDVDAITRLERELFVVGYKGCEDVSFALAPGTWSPFNCQNTAIAREVIPSYFLSPYVGRHSDILASYVVNRLAEYFGHVIAFGNPLARHTRTPHDLWKDMDIEREGMLMTDSFCRVLREVKLTATTYHEGFGQVIEGLSSWVTSKTQRRMITGMSLWHKVFNKVLGSEV